jgi:hypothetical protein
VCLRDPNVSRSEHAWTPASSHKPVTHDADTSVTQ